MNTANPQLEGLYLAISALVRRMIEKGVLDGDDLHQAMAEARRVAEEDLQTSSMSDANRKAVLFPIELLDKADGDVETFRMLARRIATGQ
jgi:hypothetical protein